jgi:hypothetical protein
MITKETLTGPGAATRLALPLEFIWIWICVQCFLHQFRGVFITGPIGCALLATG